MGLTAQNYKINTLNAMQVTLDLSACQMHTCKYFHVDVMLLKAPASKRHFHIIEN